MKKLLLTTLNIISAIIAVIFLCLIYLKYPTNNVINILHSPNYEHSENFYSHINDYLNNIFTYISLKQSFETNNELNYDKVIAESISQEGKLVTWTINDCLESASEHGLYIDTEYNVSKLNDVTIKPFEETSYNFLVKTYPTQNKLGFATEEAFITEVIDALSIYFKSLKILSGNNSNFLYKVSFKSDKDNNVIEYKNTNLSSEKIFASNAFIYLSSKDNIISSNITFLSPSTMQNLLLKNPYPNKDFVLYCTIDTSFTKNDIFKKEAMEYNSIKSQCGGLITGSIISSIIFFLTLISLLCIILNTKKNLNEANKLLFIIPTEIYIVLYIISISAAITFINKTSINISYLFPDIASLKIYFYILIIYIATIILLVILAEKYFNDTLTPLLLKTYKNSLENSSSPKPITLFIIAFIPILFFIIISFYMIYIYTIYGKINLLVIGVALFIITLIFVLYLMYLYDAFDKALKSQYKANEMRSSLIANVSHDIKTPLTSILNYTNLITTEINKPSKNYNKNITHYSDIVTNKANRLNDLINDLIFDSKVSTGNLELDIQKIDIIEFLTQVNIEFEDKLKEKGIKVIFEHQIEKVFINADSKQLYRVFQNLFSNISKYALEKSRVYMDLTINKSKLIITMKNIQKEKLEVSVNTLTDKFVRGNKSRTTEGFGLGLSITDSLVTAMNGKLEIKNVRDEFITKITFIKYDE